MNIIISCTLMYEKTGKTHNKKNEKLLYVSKSQKLEL